MPSAIEKITLNAATFHGVTIAPTLINFFYGNNGTGKSTIARAIRANDGVDWQAGKSAADYSVLVYNQAFVDANFRDYGKLKGVFTLGEHNIGIQQEITEKTALRAEQERLNGENITAMESQKSKRDELFEAFQKLCWAKTKTIREEFPSTQDGYKRPISKFVEHLLQIGTAVQHDVGTLRTLYETAYDPNAAIYSLFQPTGSTTRLKGSRGNELLGKAITSSADTPFAEFIKAINASDWVRQGHEHYTETANGKCPYCQRVLPESFEDDIAACFDAQYQTDIDDLRQFQLDYISDMRGFIEVLNTNLQKVPPKIDVTDYKARVALLEKTIAFILSAVLAGYGFGGLEPALQSMAVHIAPPERRGSANSTFLCAYDIGIGIGGGIAGLLITCCGYSKMFVIISLSNIASVILYVVWGRKHPSSFSYVKQCK